MSLTVSFDGSECDTILTLSSNPSPTDQSGRRVRAVSSSPLRRCRCLTRGRGSGRRDLTPPAAKQAAAGRWLAGKARAELPDVAPTRLNGSLRCNGRGAPPRPDSASSCSSKADSSAEGGKGAMEVRLRPWCVGVGVCLLFSALGVGIGVPLLLGAGPPQTHQQRLEVVRRILRDVPLIDGHNDLPWNVRKFVHNQILTFNFTADLMKVDPWARSNWSHTDIPRLRQGMVGGQFWSAYVPCGAQYLDAVQLTLEQIDLIKRLAEQHAEHLSFVTSAQGVRDAHRGGRIASLIGVEGGHSVGSSLAVLRTFYSLGARYMTVTHTCNTPWADCSVPGMERAATAETEAAAGAAGAAQGNKVAAGLSPAPSPLPFDPLHPQPGLTAFGRKMVREMNRLGMMIDLSHASGRTVKDAMAASRAPVLFSHSSAFALCNSSRNVPDDVLRLVASNGGLVMVSFYSYFLTCSSAASVSDVIAHINHIRKVAGIDHVGIGAGFDGINFTPTGLEDVSKYPQLFARLLEDPLWTEEDVKKLAGENLLRVFTAVETVRDKWRLAAVMPEEELIPPAYLQGHTECMFIGS